MDRVIKKLYKEFGLYSNYRSFPYQIDGLKPVERRVLLSAYQIARNKFKKSKQVDSYTTGNYHPHGEAYTTLVQMVKQGFLDGQGNFGSNVGIEPVGAAASRYTECKLSEFTYNIAFKYINTLKWEVNDLGEKEPAILPTMFPFCLMGKEYTQGIGFGYKTYIPFFSTSDLYKRLMWLLTKSGDEPVIKPISDCNITASEEDLKKLLTTGKCNIQVEGIFRRNNTNSTLILKSWPPGKRFESILNQFQKELENQDIGFTDSSSDKTNIVFQVLKQRNREAIFNKLISKMKEVLKGSIPFEIVVYINDSVCIKSVDNMLIDTYNMFTKVNKHKLVNDINYNNQLVKEYNNLEKIKPSLSHLMNSNVDIESSIKKISEDSGVSEEIIKELISKYKIRKLLTINTDTKELLEKIKLIESDLQNLQQLVLKQYEVFI